MIRTARTVDAPLAPLRRFQAAVLGSGVSDSDVWRQIGAHAALGARVLRVFAFSNGGGASRMQTPRPLQVEVSACCRARADRQPTTPHRQAEHAPKHAPSCTDCVMSA